MTLLQATPDRPRGVPLATYRALDRSQQRLSRRERRLVDRVRWVLPLLAVAAGLGAGQLPSAHRPSPPPPTARILDVQGLPAALVAGTTYQAQVTVELGETWVTADFGDAVVRVYASSVLESEDGGHPQLALACSQRADGARRVALTCPVTPPSDGAFVLNSEVATTASVLITSDHPWTRDGTGYLRAPSSVVAARQQVVPVRPGAAQQASDSWAGCATWSDDWTSEEQAQLLLEVPWPEQAFRLRCNGQSLLFVGGPSDYSGSPDAPRSFRFEGDAHGVIGIAPRGTVRVTATLGRRRVTVERPSARGPEPVRRSFVVRLPAPDDSVPEYDRTLVLAAVDTRGRVSTDRLVAKGSAWAPPTSTTD